MDIDRPGRRARRRALLAASTVLAGLALTGSPAATGDAIARALGREPGPWLADLLDLLREERLLGRVTTEAEAIRFAETWLSGAGMGGIDHDPPPAAR